MKKACVLIKYVMNKGRRMGTFHYAVGFCKSKKSNDHIQFSVPWHSIQRHRAPCDRLCFIVVVTVSLIDYFFGYNFLDKSQN